MSKIFDDLADTLNVSFISRSVWLFGVVAAVAALSVQSGCAPASFESAQVAIEIRSAPLSSSEYGIEEESMDSHEKSEMCFAVNITGVGVAMAVSPDRQGTTCQNGEKPFLGIGKISSMIAGYGTQSAVALVVPIGTRTIDLFGMPKAIFNSGECPEGRIEFKQPESGSNEPVMIVGGVAQEGFDGDKVRLFARKTVSIAPGDNIISLDVRKDNDGEWLGSKIGCGHDGDNYPQISYSHRVYEFSTTSGTTLTPTLKNFNPSEGDTCEMSVNAIYPPDTNAGDSPGDSGFLVFSDTESKTGSTTCKIEVGNTWPSVGQSPPDAYYLQVDVSVKKRDGKKNHANFFILGSNFSPGIIDVAAAYIVNSDGSLEDTLSTDNSSGNFFSSVDGSQFPAGGRYLYVVLKNIGAAAAGFTIYPTNAFGGLEYDNTTGEISLPPPGGIAISSCATNGGNSPPISGSLAESDGQCYLKFKIYPVNGSSYVQMHNFGSDSIISPGSTSTIALSNWVSLEIYNGANLRLSTNDSYGNIECIGAQHDAFVPDWTSTPTNIEASFFAVDANGYVSVASPATDLSPTCTFNNDHSELVVKIDEALNDPTEEGTNYIKAQLALKIEGKGTLDGTEIYPSEAFFSNGTLPESSGDLPTTWAAGGSAPEDYTTNLFKFSGTNGTNPYFRYDDAASIVLTYGEAPTLYRRIRIRFDYFSP